MKKITIAIDGYSACGKSTTARKVAKALGYLFIDTGAMYRAVTLWFLRHELAFEAPDFDANPYLEQIKCEFRFNPESRNGDMFLNGENVEKEIRSMQVSKKVSEVATIKAVRQYMVAQQREIGKNGGIVMDGRDIGTVVFPQAELKIFMTATLEKRIERRKNDLALRGKQSTEAQIKENILHRDHIDSNRAESPLRQAKDAILLDNTDMSIEEQVNFVLKLAEQRTKSLA